LRLFEHPWRSFLRSWSELSGDDPESISVLSLDEAAL
jgi:hypothetical protein